MHTHLHAHKKESETDTGKELSPFLLMGYQAIDCVNVTGLSLKTSILLTPILKGTLDTLSRAWVSFTY